MFKLSKILLPMAGLVGIGAAVGLLASLDNSEPKPPRVGLIEQTAAATVSGVRIEVVEATFSASETIMLAKIVGAEGTPLTDIRIEGQTPPSGLDFAPGRITAIGATESGHAVLRLPPALRAGVLRFEIQSIALVNRPNEAAVKGPWQLSLRGPDAGAFTAAMRTEELQGASVNIGGNSVLVSARRTSTRTTVSYVVPGAILELSGPTIVVGKGPPMAALFQSDVGPQRQADFPPTPFGAPVTVVFGAFSQQIERASIVSFSYQDFANRKGLRPPPNGASLSATSEADVRSEDIVDGDGKLLLRAGYGFDIQGATRRDVINLVVAGNWGLEHDPSGVQPTSPLVIDGSGKFVEVAGANSAFLKNANGDIGPGQTTISIVLKDNIDLSRLTVKLGGPFQVIGGHPSVTLSP